MARSPELLALDAFGNAATRVPAYRTLLREAGVRVEEVQNLEDFQRLPVLEKHTTFQRFDIQELCADGLLGRLGNVLTSSGHSGIFAFGLSDSDSLPTTMEWIDDALDSLFAVRSRPTLLINCLPMGVKIHTQACTLAETSVRSDMAAGLIKKFAPHFAQMILVGDAAFLKQVLEMGPRIGIDWRSNTVHLISGEEPLAENARRYLGDMLGHDSRRPENGIVISSMGVAEFGLNLFFEVPPLAPLVALRRALHENADLRHEIFGAMDWVPSLFTYDPRRIFVEFDVAGRLILTTLDSRVRIPLIRYATGDRGNHFRLSGRLRAKIEATGVSWDVLASMPIVAMRGRGEHALAGETPVYPEAVKEGIYREPELAAMVTANFRLRAEPARVRIRLQLSPGVKPGRAIESRFSEAISRYVRAPFEVASEAYEDFGSGMTLDYERKFQYLGP